MKTLSVLAVALSLLAGAAFASDQPASSNASTASAAAKSCDKEASAKKLHGDARAKYIKECKESKHTS